MNVNLIWGLLTQNSIPVSGHRDELTATKYLPDYVLLMPIESILNFSLITYIGQSLYTYLSWLCPGVNVSKFPLT